MKAINSLQCSYTGHIFDFKAATFLKKIFIESHQTITVINNQAVKH